jgi:hypothetical protein
VQEPALARSMRHRTFWRHAIRVFGIVCTVVLGGINGNGLAALLCSLRAARREKGKRTPVTQVRTWAGFSTWEGLFLQILSLWVGKIPSAATLSIFMRQSEIAS